jgi:hypothetical protein
VPRIWWGKSEVEKREGKRIRETKEKKEGGRKKDLIAAQK